MYIYTSKAIIKYCRRGTPNCKNSTVAFTKYVPKEVLYVPTDKATRYDFVNGKWQKINPT